MKVMAFYWQTGSTRLFHSLNLAQTWLPNSRELYFSPKDLLDRRKPEELLLGYEGLFWWSYERDLLHFDTEHAIYAKTPDGTMTYELVPHPRNGPRLSDSELAETIWRVGWILGDLVTRPPNARSMPGFLVDLKRCKAVLAEWEGKTLKLPKQAAMIVSRLVEESYDFYTEDEMVKFMEGWKTVKAINTKQDPWRIFRYYRPALTELGVLNPQGELKR
jgi:hypothetical protein